MPTPGNPSERGNLLVEAHVEIPRHLTDKEKSLIRELAAARGEPVGVR
jgi:DnaJ-class molecular chaperone